MESPLVAIIVLNYNGRSHLEYCLPSILETDYPNCHVLLVDNDSADDSVPWVREHYPQVEVLQTGANLGWAGGNNRGVERAMAMGAEFVVLANNDIMVHPKWVEAAVAAFAFDDCVGFVGGTVFGDLRAVPVERYHEACASWPGIEFDYTEDYIDGMALFVRTRVFDALGMIDEAFFVYAEETDFEIRGKLAGFRRMRTNVPVWHYSSGTFSKMKIRGAYLAIRNTIRLSLKHDSPLGMLKMLRRVFRIGCSPFFDGDMTDVTLQRLRPRGIVFNFFLICYCLGWNVVHLPATIRRARADYRRIRACRAAS